jgi:hypothetical protein
MKTLNYEANNLSHHIQAENVLLLSAGGLLAHT